MQKYELIYADCPWKYRVWNKKDNTRCAISHYPVMSISELCDLPIESIAASDCTLFMWVTFPLLPEAFTVLESWSFKYRTIAFVWVKRNKKTPSLFWGMGNWTRANAEICLLATKGKPKRISASVHQIIESPIEEHSRKPNITRHRIVELMGDVPRIELFARQATSGWHTWGNEIQNDITLLDNEMENKNLPVQLSIEDIPTEQNFSSDNNYYP